MTAGACGPGRLPKECRDATHRASRAFTIARRFRGGCDRGDVRRGPRAVAPTVLRAGLWSRDGASFRLLELIRGRRVEPALSVPLVLEYEMVLKRQATEFGLAPGDIDGILDFDELVLELAVAAGCRQIITFNGRDFAGSERLGVEVVTPAKFLQSFGERS